MPKNKNIYVMENDPVFILGFEKGIEMAREKLAENGVRNWEKSCVQKMLARDIEESIIAEMLDVTIQFVQQVKVKMEKKSRKA